MFFIHIYPTRQGENNVFGLSNCHKEFGKRETFNISIGIDVIGVFCGITLKR